MNSPGPDYDFSLHTDTDTVSFERIGAAMTTKQYEALHDLLSDLLEDPDKRTSDGGLALTWSETEQLADMLARANPFVSNFNKPNACSECGDRFMANEDRMVLQDGSACHPACY